MAVTIKIPAPFQRLTGSQSEIKLEGADVKELISNLEKGFPDIKGRVYDKAGKIHKFINIYVNDDSIRFLRGVETELKEGDEISIILAIAGG